MSDKDNYRKARPVFIGDVTKRDGQVKNVLNDNDKKFANVAKKSLEPFIANRYNMFRDIVGETTVGGTTTPNMRILDLLEYHVYGEYRLSGPSNNPPATTLALGFTRPDSPVPRNDDPRDLIESGRSFDQFRDFASSGINTEVGGAVVRSTYFDSVLSRSDPGSMFFLPSLGTAVMSLIPFTDAWPTSLRKYFLGNPNNQKGGRIPELFNKLVYNSNEDDNRKLSPNGNPRDLLRAPWFEEANTNGNADFDAVLYEAYGGVTPAVFAGNEINMFFISWANHFMNHPDIQNMNETDRDAFTQLIAQCALRATYTTRRQGLTKAQADSFNFGGGGPPATDAFLNGLNHTDGASMNIYGACDEFFRFLEEGPAAADPYAGKIVTFDDSTTYYNRLFVEHKVPDTNSDDSGQVVMDTLQTGLWNWIRHPNYEFEVDGEMEVGWSPDGEWLVTGGDGVGGYELSQRGYEYEFPEGMDATNSDPIGLGGEITYKLEFGIPERNRDEQIISTNWDASGEEEVALTSTNNAPSLILASRILIDSYFEMESHLQLVLNSTKISFNRYSKEYNTVDGTIVTAAVAPAVDMFYTTGGKGKKQVAEFLAEQRATIMSGIVASYLALSGDSQVRKLYEQDLKELEIGWYSETIVQRLLQARRETPVQSAMAEIRAEPYPASGGVMALQLISPQTVLRKMDVPTLRLIMEEYFGAFYESLARVAERLDTGPQKKKKGKKGKQKKLVDRMWDTVEATIVQILSLEGVRPDELWREAFRAVENARNAPGANRTAPLLPPSWAGTVFREQLTRDPRLMGTTPDVPRNITLFKTYVAFLRKSYGTNYALIAALLTAFQRTSSRQITDIEELRRFFTERLKDDEKFKIKNEGIPAYRMFVLICRRVLSAPNRQLALMLPEEAAPPSEIAIPVGAEGSELRDGLLVSGQRPIPVRANPSTSILRPDGGV